MKIAKYLIISVGVLVTLFVGSAIVAGMLEGLGIIEASEDGGRDRTPRAEEGAGRSGADRQEGDQKGRRRPVLLVTRVIDGDTVETDRFRRVRLIGVDTPEEGRCGNNSATQFTRRELEGNRVGYELGTERRDRYGRTLAYLYRTENMHELELLNRGYARVLTIPPNDKFAARFRRAERQARGGDMGVWGICRRREVAARKAESLRRRRATSLRRRRATAARRERAIAARRERRERTRERRPQSGPGGGSSRFNCGPGDIDGDNDGRCNE